MSKKAIRASSGFDRRVWLLLFAMIAFRFGPVLPFSTIHLHNVVGIPLSLVGVGLGSLAATSIVSGLVGSSMFDGARNAMIADVTQPGRRSRAYGLVRVGSNTGWALGPIVAGTLLQARLPDVIWTVLPARGWRDDPGEP